VEANARFVEWFHPKAEVIQVARFSSRRCAADSTEFAVDRHEINDRSPSAQLDQANLVLASFHRTSECAAVEAKHAVEVNNAQHEVIDFADLNHCSPEVDG
jgi:hypothetical protein